MSLFGKIARVITWPFRMVFFARGMARVRVTILALFFVMLIAGTYSWPLPYNKGVDWVNGKIDYYETFSFLRGSKPLHMDELLFRIVTGLRLHQIGFIPRSDFRLGLDLEGGTHLVYQADFSQVSVSDEAGAMDGLRDVIERRVNIFGVAEPIIQINRSGKDWRLIVELAGVHDTSQAIQMIGEAPLLEFKEVSSEAAGKDIAELAFGDFISTELAGGEHLNSATVQFDPTTGEPVVSLEFDSEGSELFHEITKRNVEKPLAIFIDGIPISIPRVNEPISGGRAIITGSFTLDEAKALARNLNAGAVSVPITLLSQQTVGASLGKESLEKSISAALVGAILVIIFMLLIYRLQGILAVFALGLYLVILLTFFKLFSVTLTLAGIAGFILSLGMAVDANILIFERMREERRSGKSLALSIEEGFARAWTSIRDGNISTLITAGILFWFGTGFVQGFALVLVLGVAVSMFSAIFVTKNLLKLFIGTRFERASYLWR